MRRLVAWCSRRAPLRAVLTPFLLSRLWIGLFVYAGHAQRPYLEPVRGGWEGVSHWLLNPWTTYDTLWFFQIATTGYRPESTPFFPLYPLLLRLAGRDPVAMALWGVLLSNVALLAALFFLARLCTVDHDEQVARIAVWILAFFPIGAFHSAVYTDSLFLCLLVAAFYLVRRERWVGAGVLGFLASLTRNPGAILALACLIEYAVGRRAARRRLQWPALISLCLPLLGFLAVQTHFAVRFGGMLSGVQSQGFYYRAVGWPWTPILKDAANLFSMQGTAPVTGDIVGVLLAFFLLFHYRRRIRLSYALLLLSILLAHLTYQRVIPPYTVATLRYLALLFPFIQLLALGVRELIDRHDRAPLLFIAYLFPSAVMSYWFGLKWFLG